MRIVHRDIAMKDRSAHSYLPGVGYIHVDKPSLPAQPVAQASACEPPPGTEDGTWHALQPPNGAPVMRLQWHAVPKEWIPPALLMAKSRRLSFTSAYLAAHGWSLVKDETPRKKARR